MKARLPQGMGGGEPQICSSARHRRCRTDGADYHGARGEGTYRGRRRRSCFRNRNGKMEVKNIDIKPEVIDR